MNKQHKKRILFIVQHRFNRSPGQRYRCEQYIPYLEKAGFDWEYSPLLVNEAEDKGFYSPGNYITKLQLFAKAAWRRLRDAFRAKHFDIIFVYREAFMTGTLVFEKMLKRSGAKLVFDFDDAIWNYDISAGNKALGFLKRPQKVNEIMTMADLVIAGNAFLADHAFQYSNRVEIFPSTIDLEYYSIQPKISNNSVVIGWSGSLTTIEHFKSIIPVLKKIKQQFGKRVSFRVFGCPEYSNQELEVEGIKWTPQNEVEQITQFDIGIMPLPDNEWTRGKCGMKGLQYMALEVATIMSAVGVNKEIIQEGQNGLLAATEQEWIEKISRLVEDGELRNLLGKAGRQTIEQYYSCQALAPSYVKHLNRLLQS